MNKMAVHNAVQKMNICIFPNNIAFIQVKKDKHFINLDDMNIQFGVNYGRKRCHSLNWCCIILLVRGQVNKEAMANIDPKSVTPAERVSTFPGEPLTVSKLFCEYSLQRRTFLKRAYYRVPWEVSGRHE